MSRRSLVLAAACLGLALRVLGLPLWGTFDTEVQKAWAARAARSGVADIYGPPDAAILAQARERGGGGLAALWSTPVPRTSFRWGSADYFVDYPPGSLLVLWTAGRLEALRDPELANRWPFNAAINLAPLLGSIAMAWLLARSSRESGTARALASWLNPALILAAPVLGYQDAVFGAFALAAVLAMVAGRLAAATAWSVVAGLIKPQGVLLIPTLLVLLLRDARPREWLRAALLALAASALILAPWWTQGYLLSALDGCRRPLTQTTLAPLGLSLWWAAGWWMDQVAHGAALARVVGIDEFAAWAGWDPRWPARLLVAAATAVNVWLLLRAGRGNRAAIPLSVIVQVHVYALFATGVHENHTLLAVFLAPLLIGAHPRGRAVVALTSAFAFLSLFFAAGLGRRVTRLATLEALRGLTPVDASVLVALLHAALLALLVTWAWRARPAAATV